tara:strand:- start:28471 stop:28653 length:183 start_codon:yes stop_codon:yes gene_type:complete
MIEKLKSRKLWAAFLGVTITFFSDSFNLPAASTQWIVTILTGYILGQGIADAGAGITKPK